MRTLPSPSASSQDVRRMRGEVAKQRVESADRVMRILQE